jgi:hypothetical protein
MAVRDRTRSVLRGQELPPGQARALGCRLDVGAFEDQPDRQWYVDADILLRHPGWITVAAARRKPSMPSAEHTPGPGSTRDTRGPAGDESQITYTDMPQSVCVPVDL